MQAAVDHLRGALDGFQPGPPGTPPAASPYPGGAFVRTTTDLALGGVPALAIGGRLAGDLVGLLAPALAQVAQQRVLRRDRPDAPRPGLAHGTRAAGHQPRCVAVDAWLRRGCRPVPAHRGPRARAAATGPVGPRPGTAVAARRWLAGSPTTFTGLGLPMVEARARWAELGLTITPDGSGGVALTPYATVADGSVRGVPVTGALGSPDLASGLGAVFQALSVPPPAAGGRLDAVLNALAALGLVARDASGAAGLASDAVASLLVDAKGYLEPRLRAAMAAADGWAGLAGRPEGRSASTSAAA